MKKEYIQKFLSFLIGLSWGSALLSFLVIFDSYLHLGFLTALVFALFAFLIGILFVVLFEYMSYRVGSSEAISKKLDRLIELLGERNAS